MKFDIRRSKIGGKGCFATKDINKEEVIKRLSGEVVSRTEINKRILKGIERIDDPLQIGDDLFIDLDEPSYFFNHSCNPNAGIRRKSELFAIKGISKGEEITFDYSTTVGKDIDWIMNCHCQSKNCRKKIGNILTIPKRQLERYDKLGAIPDFIKKQIAPTLL